MHKRGGKLEAMQIDKERQYKRPYKKLKQVVGYIANSVVDCQSGRSVYTSVVQSSTE
jgi:hypothetical protein